MGQRTIDERLLSKRHYGEVLYGLPKVQKAFVYRPENIMKVDIGLLIIDIPMWIIAFDLVSPIGLPDKG